MVRFAALNSEPVAVPTPEAHRPARSIGIQPAVVVSRALLHQRLVDAREHNAIAGVRRCNVGPARVVIHRAIADVPVVVAQQRIFGVGTQPRLAIGV